jgi:hypothetical protein
MIVWIVFQVYLVHMETSVLGCKADEAQGLLLTSI